MCVCVHVNHGTCIMVKGQSWVLVLMSYLVWVKLHSLFVHVPYFIFFKKKIKATLSPVYTGLLLLDMGHALECDWYIRDHILKTDIASPCNYQMSVAPQLTVEQSPSPPHLSPSALCYAGNSRAWSVSCGFCYSHRDFIFIPDLLHQKNSFLEVICHR